MIAAGDTRVRHLTTVLVVVLALAVPLLAGGMTWALVVNGQQTSEIQQQRARSIRDACTEQNRRHDRTITQLDRLLAERLRTATPAIRRQLRASRAGTVLLIEALAPRRRCDLLVRSATTS